MMNQEPIVQVRDICKTFEIPGRPPIHALQNVTNHVDKGEVLVVIGPSGSGKSTFLRALNGLQPVDSGSITIDGVELTSPKTDLNELRQSVGMVFQNFNLFQHKTALENITMPQMVVLKRSRDEADEIGNKLLERVGIGDRGDNYPSELSGGQQQRVGIARSLAVEPDVWFLDEPFSALDPLIRAEMQDEFLRLQKMLKKTIVFITHDFEEATKLADRIGIMKDGRMVQMGTPEELILHPADDYVAAFAQNAPRDRIVSAKAIMEPFSGGKKAKSDTGVAADAKIGTIAAQVIAADTPTLVIGTDGKPVGQIGRAHV